jgi:hypothetical protein
MQGCVALSGQAHKTHLQVGMIRHGVGSRLKAQRPGQRICTGHAISGRPWLAHWTIIKSSATKCHLISFENLLSFRAPAPPHPLSFQHTLPSTPGITSTAGSPLKRSLETWPSRWQSCWRRPPLGDPLPCDQDRLEARPWPWPCTVSPTLLGAPAPPPVGGSGNRQVLGPCAGTPPVINSPLVHAGLMVREGFQALDKAGRPLRGYAPPPEWNTTEHTWAFNYRR